MDKMPERYCVEYLGSTVLDRRFSTPMIPWVISDIRRRGKIQRINVRIEDGHSIGCTTEGTTLFSHPLSAITRFCHEKNNLRTYMYLVRDEFTEGLHAHLFHAFEFEDVVEIFQTMKEGLHPPRSHSSAASLTSLCSDISPSNSQFFEVLYVGKIKVSHRHVPETFIDDALERIQQHELEKQKKLEVDKDYFKSKSLEMGRKISASGEIIPASALITSQSHTTPTPNPFNPHNIPTTIPSSVTIENKFPSNTNSLHIVSTTSTVPRPNIHTVPTSLAHVTALAPPPFTNPSYPNSPDLSSTVTSGISAVNYPVGIKKQNCDNIIPILPPPPSQTNASGEPVYRRNRAGSLGVIETMRTKKTEDPNHNRTMLFYVGRQDIKLISPDRKQVLLHKMLKDITTCTQGVQKAEHFGLVCREVDSFVGYVFRCESESVAEDVVAAINQSFHYIRDHKPVKQPVLSCEHCPMVWYHKLCAEIENQSEKKCQMTILKRIESLPEEDQEIIHTKLLGAESSEIKDQVDFLMILLRAHCEAKQSKHLHDTVENRSEFLNQYLGGSTIFMKAKRSLTSSFDQLLKRKGSNMDITSSQSNSKESLHRRSPGEHTVPEEPRRRSSTVGTVDVEQLKKELKLHASQLEAENELKNGQRGSSVEYQPKKKPSLSDIAALTVNNQKIEKNLRTSEDDLSEENESQKTPMINIFLKVGSTTKASEDPSTPNRTPNASWRQIIFNTVVTPSKTDEEDLRNRKKTSQEYRALWRKAINQQVLLIRMERENARLRARQEEATVKRIKLEYDELGSSSREYMGIWDLISKDTRVSSSRCDAQMLLQAIRQGVPRGKRGEVWHFLASQFCMKQPPFDATKFPNYDVPYEDLLKKLTSCQHAILIDLGRTFPNHPYFASPLGPGQLALFNLLKAYSLLDPQVGYCQGLSFVAGVLLLHMAEDQAFLLLRHIMFRRGLRKQYLPDMAALQVHLYQLSRLLHDHYPQLYQHLDKNEIAPTLYAAPWILTIFASQFPLGFVTRVFDLMFLESSTDITFRVILALLSEHREQIMELTSFEDVMEYLKSNVPKVDGPMLDKVMKKVLSMDISKQLHEYEVEYHVLQEEMSTARPEQEQLKRLTLENSRLTDQNLALIEQLEVVNQAANRLERSRVNQQAQITKLETQIRNLEITIATLGDFIEDIGTQHKDIEVPGDIRRLIANLELAEQRSSKQLRELKTKKTFDKSALLKRSQTSMGFYERPDVSELYTAEDLPNGTKYGEKKRGASPDEGPRPVLKGVPLRVIIDEDDEKKPSPPSPSNFSKLTSGVSSFFNSTQSKNHKNVKKYIPDGKLNDSFHIDEEPNIKRNFSSDIGSINLKDSVVNTKKLVKTQSEMTINLRHPLDTCNDVNITYNGVTKLKSLKPNTRPPKSQTIDLISLGDDILQVNEDYLDSKDGSKLLNPKVFDPVTEKF